MYDGRTEELVALCQRLWEVDANRLQGDDYSINLQRGKRIFEAKDTAPDPLFSYVKPQVLSRPTYAAFRRLLDNYSRSTGVAEVSTPETEREISHFLDTVLATGPMQTAHRFLAEKNLVASGHEEFKQQLYQMWFRLYTREARDDTCGFEHVFVGEVDRESKVIGFHNWMQFSLMEAAGQVNYLGFIMPHGRQQGHVVVDNSDRLISVQFAWQREIKDISSVFLGTSPEFELALYTTCFVAGREETPLSLDCEGHRYDFKIRAYRIKSKYGDKVGSAFPELVAKHVSDRPPHGNVPFAPATPEHPAWQQLEQSPPAWPQHQGQVSPGSWGPPAQQSGYPQGGLYPVQAPYGQQGPGAGGDQASQGCGGVLKMVLQAILQRVFKR